MDKVVILGEDLEHLADEFRHVCEALESGNLSLEESLETYEQGVRLEKKIQAILTNAEQRIVEVINKDGTIESFDAKR